MSTDAIIFGALLFLPFINWPVAIMLIRLARIRPTIRALTERAVLALVIAVATTTYVLVAVNTEIGFAMFDFEIGKVILRLLILAIGLFPLWWLWSYYKGRFHGGLDDEIEESAKLGRDRNDAA